MWWYKNVTREEFEKCKDKAEKIMEELGAERMDIQMPYRNRRTSYSGSLMDVCDKERAAYVFRGEYFRVDEVLFREKPFIVIEGGSREELMNNTLCDADPFPYDLSRDEMIEEVEWSLGIRDNGMSGRDNEKELEFIPYDDFKVSPGEAPEFEIKRVLTGEDFRKFFEFSFLKYHRGWTIFSLAFIVIMLFMGVRGRAVGLDIWWVFILTAVLTVVYTAVYAVRANRTNMSKTGREVVYLFYPDCMVNRFGNEEASVAYSACEAFEYGGRIFIIVNEKAGYILSVNDIPEPEKFHEFLRNKLGDKFKK